MSIFKPNLDTYSSAFFVAPIDDYELELMKISVAKRSIQNVDVVVPRFSFRIVSGDMTGTEFANKPVNWEPWLKEEKDFDQILQFGMAAFGIKPGTKQADEEFKMRYGSLDWSIDADSNILGEVYEKMLKARVKCKLTSTPDKKDPEKMYQRFGRFGPI